MEPQKCILITGFGPFRDIKQNISWCAVEGLSKVWPDHWPPLVTREIPVAYSEVRRIVPKLWQELQPRLVVHVGVDSQGGMFHLEQCSHNAGYNKCDVNDMICEGESCLANPDRPVEDCIRTQLDLETVLKRVKSAWNEELGESAPLLLEQRDDAGRYLCEFIYYSSLCQDSTRSIFVHVPDFDKPYSLSQVTAVLKLIVAALLDQV